MSWYHSLSQSESLPSRNSELIDGSPRQDSTLADKKSWGMLLRSSVQINPQTVGKGRNGLSQITSTMRTAVRSALTLNLFNLFSVFLNSLHITHVTLKKCRNICLKQIKVKCVSSYLVLRILNESYFGRWVLTIVVYSKFHHLYSSVWRKSDSGCSYYSLSIILSYSLWK